VDGEAAARYHIQGALVKANSIDQDLEAGLLAQGAVLNCSEPVMIGKPTPTVPPPAALAVLKKVHTRDGSVDETEVVSWIEPVNGQPSRLENPKRFSMDCSQIIGVDVFQDV